MIVGIPLHRKHRVVGHALVDEADADRVLAVRWTLTRSGRAMGYWKDHRRSTDMSRFVLGMVPGSGRFAHHINEDPLDNRRENLQVFATASEHGMAPHPKRDAKVRAAVYRHIAANPGWPFHYANSSEVAA